MADKPLIALPRGEWDARSLVLADQDASLWEWDDISGAGNDLQPIVGAPTYQAAGGVGTPWSDTLPAVKMDDQPAFDSWGVPFAPGTVGNAFTYFVVAEATDLTNGMAFWGSSDAEETPGGPRGIYLFITDLGEAGLIIGAPFVTYLRSAPGLISPGDRVIITARRFDTPQNPPNTSGPCILRVNGVEVSSSSASGFVQFWFNEQIGRCNLQSSLGFPGDILGRDGLYAHLLQYASAASDEEILQMEAFLREIWIGGPWVPSNVPLGSVWTPS